MLPYAEHGDINASPNSETLLKQSSQLANTLDRKVDRGMAGD